jgi:predicted RNA polymerase sigma factor
VAPSPVMRLNRAVALGYVAGPEVAKAEVEELARDLEGCISSMPFVENCCLNSGAGFQTIP